MISKRVRRPLVALAAAMVGVGLAAVGPPGIANAYRGQCFGNATPSNLINVDLFQVEPSHVNEHLVTVVAFAAMPRSDAQRFVDNPGHEASFKMWGDDEWDDDFIQEWKPDAMWADDAGLGIRGGANVADNDMNEDSAPDVSAVHDEWYIGVHLDDIRDGKHHAVQSCGLSLAF